MDLNRLVGKKKVTQQEAKMWADLQMILERTASRVFSALAPSNSKLSYQKFHFLKVSNT